MIVRRNVPQKADALREVGGRFRWNVSSSRLNAVLTPVPFRAKERAGARRDTARFLAELPRVSLGSWGGPTRPNSGP